MEPEKDPKKRKREGNGEGDDKSEGKSTEPEQVADPKRRKVEKLLECPICMHMMGPPIYQCLRGHLLCSSCHAQVSSCPTCRVVLDKVHDPIRALALEQLIEIQEVLFPCTNETRGCQKRMLWGQEKRDHEAQCDFRLVACPCRTHKVTNQAHCQALLKLSEIEDHCVKQHGASAINGPAGHFTVSHAAPDVFLVPQFIGKNLVVFGSRRSGDFKAFARHIQGPGIKYCLSLSAHGCEVSFTGETQPIDVNPRQELDGVRVLSVHKKMMAAIGTQRDMGVLDFRFSAKILAGQ